MILNIKYLVEDFQMNKKNPLLYLKERGIQ